MPLEHNIRIGLSTNIINWRRKISCFEFSFLELLATRIGFFYRLLMSWRKPVFLKEIKMADVTSKDKVFFIGCGILPSEAILIAEETKAEVVTIDNSYNVYRFAKSYVQKKGFSDKIRVEYGDGVDYPVEKFGVIFVAISVWPIDSVLKHLSQNVKKGTRIMCKGMKNDILDTLSDTGLYDMFSVKSVLENPKTQSFLLTKK